MSPMLPDKQISIQWVGDICPCGRYCSPHYHSAIEASVVEIIADVGPCDLRVGNIEAPLWGSGRVNTLKSPRVCTTAEAAKCILPLELDVALLANNHVYDCLEDGFKNTLEFLRGSLIHTIGAGFTREEAERPLILHKRDVKIAVLNSIDKEETHPRIPENAKIFTHDLDRLKILQQVAQLANDSVVLVFIHCGDTELVRLPSPRNRKLARHLIDAGATLVAFDHAHCLGGYEKRGNGYISYGLGNFIFGDIDGKMWPEISHHTALAELTVSRNDVALRFRYYYSKDKCLVLDNQSRQKRRHDKLSRKLEHGERRYRLDYRRELFYQKVIVAYVNFVKRSGGLIPSLCKLRKEQLRVILRMLGLKSMHRLSRRY